MDSMAGNELARRDPVDRLLITHARKSPNEIAEITGLPATEALVRLGELLDNRDHLTMRRHEALLLEEFNDLLHDARSRMKGASDRDYAPIASVALRAVEQMASRLDAQRKAVKIDYNKITEGQSQVFGKGFDVALHHILEGLRARYDIPEDLILQLHREGMQASFAYLQENIEESE
jgi:hypothetical protein